MVIIFMKSSIFSNVAPEIEAFTQFGETFPSLLQLEALSKTFTELLSSVVGLLSACPDVSFCMQITTGRSVHTANRQTIPITDVLLNRHQ
jgi:hypothetical protein